jgi:hypothetical protein
MKKFYKDSVIIPSIFAFGFNLIYNIIVLIVDRDYKSEWLTNESAFFVSIIMVILNCVFISGLSLTIFLNKYQKVMSNLLLSILSWFLLSGIWIGYILTRHVNYWLNSQNGIDSESVFVLTNTIPFLIGLIYTFIRFRLEKNKLMGD